jgi:hypothetical protein
MKRVIFQDFYREEKTPHLWLYFFISLVIHLVVFRVAMDTPMEVRMPDSRQKQEVETRTQQPPLTVKKPEAPANTQTSPQEVQSPNSGVQSTRSHDRPVSEAGSIEGVVTNNRREMVMGMEVIAVPVDMEEAGTVYRAVTNGDGEFEFAQLPQGHYNIEVNSPAFSRELGQPVKVVKGTPIILNLEIVPEGARPASMGMSPPAEPLRISVEEYRKLFENPSVQAFQQALGQVMVRVDRTLEFDIEAMLRQLWFQEIVGDLLIFWEELATQLDWLGRRIIWLFF